jgi:hypothetical protein
MSAEKDLLVGFSFLAAALEMVADPSLPRGPAAVYERAKYHYNTIITDCVPDSAAGLWPPVPGAPAPANPVAVGANVIGAISQGVGAIPGVNATLAAQILAIIQGALGAGASPAAPAIPPVSPVVAGS